VKTKGNKRKAKDVAADSTVKGRDESMLHLPSVPSTQHIAPKGKLPKQYSYHIALIIFPAEICTSAFFSLYRPISLTKSFPKAVTEEAFASIFTHRAKSNKPSDIISVIAGAVSKLDAVTGKVAAIKIGTEQGQWDEKANRKTDAHVQHLDSCPEETGLNFNGILVGHHPFQPPPAPKPMDTNESLAAGAEAAKVTEPQHRTYTAVLTIEESTDSNGEVTYLAHSSPLVAELPPASPPTRFLERMQIRQERYREQRAEENDMFAISVKRQRKLKMKKHKYKKLMRRTRNLRRRLDRN
jgi:hypothetical protein